MLAIDYSSNAWPVNTWFNNEFCAAAGADTVDVDVGIAYVGIADALPLSWNPLLWKQTSQMKLSCEYAL